jgi:tetratricopeptide (TPR) repeat protein
MSVPIKLQLNDQQDLRRIKVDPAISHSKLVDLLKSLFKQVPGADWDYLTLSYVDNENESCNITGELELREAFYAKKSEVLKLELSFRRKPNFVPFNPLVFPFQRPQCNTNNQAPQQQKRVCWPDQQRFGPRRMQMLSFQDEGIALMDAKKYQEAKAIFEKQVEMIKCPWKKSTPLYNIACCESLLGNADSALAYLAQAISHGFRNVQHMEQDEDLKALHGLDAFDVMVSELKTQQVNQQCNRPWRGKFWRCGENVNTNEVKPSCETSVPSSTGTEPAEYVVLAEAIPVEVSTPVPVANAEPTPTQSAVSEPAPVIQPVEVIKPAPKRSEPAKVESYEGECNALLAMGFTNVKKNMRTLMKTKGNLSEAVRLLLQ